MTKPLPSHLIPLTAVTIENRQRTSIPLSSVIELADSIERDGLLNPITLTPDGRLVAGERRFRAITLLNEANRSFHFHGTPVPKGQIPYTITHHTTEADLTSVELYENLARESLSWQDEARAKARLHELRRAENPAQTFRQTATEINSAKGTPRVAEGSEISAVSTATELLPYLDRPEVAKAKSAAEGLRVVRKIRREEAIKNAPQSTKHTLIEGNFREVELPEGYFDCILTDPPYGVNAQDFGDAAAAEHEYQDTFENFLEFLPDLAVVMSRVAKPEAHAYVFCDLWGFPHIQSALELHGWSVWRYPIIWSKGAMGILSVPYVGPRHVYECILYAHRGGRQTLENKLDVVTFAPVTDHVHGAEKPVPLYTDLLARTCLPGETVIDLFAGSGTIFPAANKCGVRATGVELNPEFCKIARGRFEE
jgi:DNA modification methylase